MLLNRFDLKRIIEYGNEQSETEKIKYTGEDYEFKSIKYIDVDVDEENEIIEVITKMEFDKCNPKTEEQIKELNELFGVDDFYLNEKIRYNLFSFKSKHLWYNTIYQF